MEIKTIDNIDYLVTKIEKVNNRNEWNTIPLFTDMKECIDVLRDYYQTDFITEEYGKNVEHLYRKYNTDYFSPTFMTAFNANPVGNLVHQIYDTGVTNTVGVTFHKVMELYYKLPKGERTREKALEITKEVCNDNNISKVTQYVEFYFKRHKDYLGGELDDSKLECLTEHKNKANIFVKSLVKELPMKLKYIVDRIDYRDDKIYLIDYKTGSPTVEKANNFKGYLPQMTMYRWAVESEFGMEVEKVYLNCPRKVADFYIKINSSPKIDAVVFDMCEQFYKKYQYRLETGLLKYVASYQYYDNEAERETMYKIWDAKVGESVEILVRLGEHNHDIKDILSY